MRFLIVEGGTLESDEEKSTFSLSPLLPSPISCLCPTPLFPSQKDGPFVVVVGCVDGCVRGIEFSSGKVVFEKSLSPPTSPSSSSSSPSPFPTCIKVIGGSGQEEAARIVVGFGDGCILGEVIKGFTPLEDEDSLTSSCSSLLSASLSLSSSCSSSSSLPPSPPYSPLPFVWGCNITYPSPVRNLVVKEGRKEGEENCLVASHAGMFFWCIVFIVMIAYCCDWVYYFFSLSFVRWEIISVERKGKYFSSPIWFLLFFLLLMLLILSSFFFFFFFFFFFQQFLLCIPTPQLDCLL